MVHPVDSLLKASNATRYRFCKDERICVNTVMSYASRGTPVDSISSGVLVRLAHFLGLSIDETYRRLKEYENEKSPRGS